MRCYSASIVLLLLLLFSSCKKEVETRSSDRPQAFVALAPGKFRIYRVDSLVFTNSGRTSERRSYQERHVVDTILSSATNEKVWRVFRFIRDSAGTQAWRPIGSYTITITPERLETNEDNLRIIRLIHPANKDVSWKGNVYLPTQPFQSLYDFSIDDDMARWDFQITETGGSFNRFGAAYNDVLTVRHIDEDINANISLPGAYAARMFSTDKYARNIGLVYQHFILWEYQPATGSGTTAFSVGFGVERTLLQYN